MPKSLTSWQVVVLTLVVACIGIAPTFSLLWPKWVDSFSYSHGVLVVPFCAWLLWKQRDEINAMPASRNLLAGIPLLGLLFAWAIAYAASIEIGTSVTMPLILLCAVLFSVGLRIAWVAAFPILLLYSVIPIWDFINGSLQSMTTKAVAVILAAINVPAYIQGNSVQIPSGWFEIAGGCSGLHFFIVGVTLAAAYSYMYLGTFKNRVILLAVAAALSIGMNWIRVATIITAGHITDMQSFLVKIDHYYFGWVLFALMLLPFFFFAHWLETKEGTRVAPARQEKAADLSPAGGLSLLVVCAVLVLPALVWGRLIQNQPAPFDIELPAIEGWQGPVAYQGEWQPAFRGPDAESLASYERAGHLIQVYVNWYQSQSQSRELVGYGNSVSGDKLRGEYDRKFVDITRTDHAKSLEIREIMTYSRAGDRRLIWYYYRVGGDTETSTLRAKLKQGLRTVAGKDGAGLLALSVTCAGDDGECDQARRVLRQAFAAIDTEIGSTLDELGAK